MTSMFFSSSRYGRRGEGHKTGGGCSRQKHHLRPCDCCELMRAQLPNCGSISSLWKYKDANVCIIASHYSIFEWRRGFTHKQAHKLHANIPMLSYYTSLDTFMLKEVFCLCFSPSFSLQYLSPSSLPASFLFSSPLTSLLMFIFSLFTGAPSRAAVLLVSSAKK